MKDFLSARAKTALSRHQREVVTHIRELQASDRVLSGALSACDAATQRESMENHLEAAQELRVALQRLEAFVLQKLVGPSATKESTHWAIAPGSSSMDHDSDE